AFNVLKCGVRPSGVGLGELLLKRGILGSLCDTRLLNGIEYDGRGVELIENEYEDADEQDHELHRDLEKGTHKERRAALADGLCGKEALYLALIAAEIREEE